MGLFKKEEKLDKSDIINPNEKLVGTVVLIKVAPRYERKVYDALVKLNLTLNLTFELYPVLGEYDIVLIIHSKPIVDLWDVFRFVANNIRTIEGVIETYTSTIPKL